MEAVDLPVCICNHKSRDRSSTSVTYFLLSHRHIPSYSFNGFVKQRWCTSHIHLCMTPAVMFSKHPVMPPFFPFLPPPSRIICIPLTRPYIFPPVCLLLSPVYNLCDHCCFSAWFSSSSAWMNSYPIKLALTGSDLPSPSPRHTPTPGSLGSPPRAPSLLQHLCFALSFDILAPSVI